MEFLTQKEIDVLLSAALAGGNDGAPVLYNFRRPPKLPRERLAVLEAIHTRFALAFQALLSNRLRQSTDVVMSSVELVTFNEYQMSIGGPCAAFVLGRGEPGDFNAILDVDARFASYLVDRMFGGPGEGGDTGRAMTPLEVLVLTNLVERVLILMQDAWGEHLPFAPSILSFQSDPETVRLVAPEEIVVVVNLNVTSGVGVGSITLCLPITALKSFLTERREFVAKPAVDRTDQSDARRRIVEHHLRCARIPVVARLPEFCVTAFDVSALHVGQILSTGQAAGGPVELHVNGRSMFFAALGKHQGKVGVQVTEPVPATTISPRTPRRTSKP